MPSNATPSMFASGGLSGVWNLWNQTAPPLLNHDNYATFASLDLDYFLDRASKRIRDYCDWHIYPQITTSAYCDLTGDGTIILPTRHLVSVVSVTPPWPGATPVDSNSYYTDQRGWITFMPYAYGFAPTPASVNLWPIDTVRLFDAYKKHNLRMLVTFVHGYSTLPQTIEEVAFELVMRALEKPAGVATQVGAGPYNFRFSEFGMVLSEDQKQRLSHYMIAGVT